MTATRTAGPIGVDGLLAAARSRLDRLSPTDALAAVTNGDGLVDIRPEWQRRDEGEIPGAYIVERNHLEWRLDPTSSARLSAARVDRRWVVVCSEGYTSSLAADVLSSIGVPATDVVGGFRAWKRDGLPTRTGVTAVGAVVS